MNVLSLFDGMSCLQIALVEAGISYETYYASEIDKHAIGQTQLNFPNTKQLGSVTEWRSWDIDWKSIGLIGAGSPCQGFSFAGKQLAFNDPRSVLFFTFIDILNHCKKFNPDVKFLLENVDMKREHMNVINNYCGLFGININSNLVSAQNRSRWYWSNIRTKQVGLFSETHTDIPQPKDEGILLKDILESEVDERYYLSDKMLNYFSKRAANFNNGKVNIRDIEDKSSCLTSSMSAPDISDNFIKVDTNLKKSNDQEKANCFTAGGNSGGLHSDMTLIVATKNYLQWDVSGKGYKSQQDRTFYSEGKHGTLSSARSDNKTGVFENNRIRRLTPTECARLQTIPDWYKWECSATQQYRMLGNGWTVKIITYILNYLK